MTPTRSLEKEFLVSKNVGISGFSLIELLVVIAVIAVIAAIAIPSITGVVAATNDTKNRQNAQTIASTFVAARAAGMTNSVANENAAVNLIRNGVNVRIGSVTNTFRVPGMTTAEATAARTYLLYTGATTNGTLRYMATTN